MGFQILSESYGRRLPKITAEADSTDDFVALGTDYAEGSTCTVGGEDYVLDKVGGWVIPGSGGGGGGFTLVEFTSEDDTFTIQTKAEDLYDAASTGCVYARISYPEEAGGGTAISPLVYAASLTDGSFLFKIYDVWDNQNDLVLFNAATGDDFPTGSINP